MNGCTRPRDTAPRPRRHYHRTGTGTVTLSMTVIGVYRPVYCTRPSHRHWVRTAALCRPSWAWPEATSGLPPPRRLRVAPNAEASSCNFKLQVAASRSSSDTARATATLGTRHWHHPAHRAAMQGMAACVTPSLLPAYARTTAAKPRPPLASAASGGQRHKETKVRRI